MPVSELDLACRSSRWLVSDSSPPTGVVSSLGTFQVGRSGQSILYSPTDAQGNPLTVTALRNTDDVQILTQTGVPAGTTFTLQLGDATTKPIPLQPAPPLTSFLWGATVPAAGSYDLSYYYGFTGPPPAGRGCSRALVEVFDSNTRIGSVLIDQTVFPDPATDLAVPQFGVFKSLGTFNLTSTSLTLRLSGEANNGDLLAGIMRVAPHGTTDPTLVGYIDPSPNRATESDGNLEGHTGIARFGNWTLDYFHTEVGSWHGYWYASPTGTQSTALPALADLQTALQNLPTIPPGSVTVTAVSNQVFTIAFGGVLSGTALPTLIPSDSAFRITHDDTNGSSVGGQFPQVQVNGVTYPLRAVSAAPGWPVVVWHLVQDAPAVQYARCGQGLFNAGYALVNYGLGFCQRTTTPNQPGQVGTCWFEGLPGPAEYQVDLTWPAGDLAADQIQCTIQDGLGHTLATVSALDQSQPPSDYQEAGVGWRTLAQVQCPAGVNKLLVTFNFTPTAPGKHCLLDTVRLQRVSPPQTTQIGPNDTVLFHASAGFVTTTNGPMGPALAVPVAPAPARRVPTVGRERKTMKLGMNCDYPTYYGVDSCFSNIAIQMNNPVGLEQSAAGNPTRLAYDPTSNMGYTTTQLTLPPADAQGQGLGAPNCASGVWVVQWTSAQGGTCNLRSFSPTTTVVEDTTRRVAGPTYRRYYHVQDSISAAPSLRFEFFSPVAHGDGTYACDIQNVAVYPPDVDPDQPGRWRPDFLRKVKQVQCFRFMDMFGTNNLNLSRFTDFPDAKDFPLGYSGRKVLIPIATIGPPTPDPFCESVSGTVVRVTTTVPHGLATGYIVSLRTTDGTSLGPVLGSVIDPKTNQTTTTARDPIDPTDGPQYVRNLCRVIDATTLQVGLEVYYGPVARMNNTLTPSHGVVYADVAVGAMMAPSDAAQLCVDGQVEPWVNVPWLADDDCVTQLAQAFVAKIAPGTQVHVEYGNEGWNYSFLGYHYCAQMGSLLYGTTNYYVPYYVTRMGQVHQIFQDVWQRAGRNPREIRRVCGAQAGNAGGITTPILEYAIQHGVSFDELAPASYFNNNPIEGSYDDLLTREQLLDLMGVNIRLSVTTLFMADQQRAVASALAAHPQATWLSQIELVNYEGGPGDMTTDGMTANIANRNHGVHRHPDFYEIMLYQLQTLQDAGVCLFNAFTMYGIRDLSQWGIYEGFQMPPGTGDATRDAANRDDFENLRAITSETGGAMVQWASLLQPPANTGMLPRNESLRAFGRLIY